MFRILCSMIKHSYNESRKSSFHIFRKENGIENLKNAVRLELILTKAESF